MRIAQERLFTGRTRGSLDYEERQVPPLWTGRIEPEPLPEGKWPVIYADPPWHYENETKPSLDVRDQYPTMTADDLAALPVQDVAERDSLLFMWTTGPTLEEAITLGRAWSFDYKTIAFVWDKGNPPLPGAYTLSQCELCLVFKRKGGNIPQPRGSRTVRQLAVIPKTIHSAKPHEIRLRIESMFPTQRKLELFARQRAERWDAWGNEV